jgi:hypothetical protein
MIAMNKGLKKTLLAAALLGTALSNVTTSPAATYYVSITGNNANTGLQGSPWRTIQYAAGRVTAGDTVRVSGGTYDERVTIQTSGSPGNFINFVGSPTGTGVVMYGFSLTDKSNVRIIGFEIRHVNTAYRAAVFLSGVCSNIMILDNYIHDTSQEGIQTSVNATPTYITIRGNTLYYISHPGAMAGANTAIAACAITPNHWLVEYNHIQRTMDFMDVYGSYHIFRNNWMHDYSYSYYTANGHSDMFQPGSDGQNVGTKHHVYERNFTGDSATADSHFGIWQDTVGAGDTNMLIRGNVGFNIGGGGIGNIGTSKMSTYNNTFHNMCNQLNGAIWIWYRTPTVGGLLANSIISGVGQSRDAVIIESGQQVTVMRNLGYQAGAESAYVSTSDPLFLNAALHDFRLQAGSPAINAGTNVAWVTSAPGSGTTFNINDGQLFIDGWGICDGDTITVGATTTRITRITGNSVTVADPVIWISGTPVYWGAGANKDMGAFPFGSRELTGAALTQSGTTYTVTPIGDARGVWFYVDGVPTVWDSTLPFTATIPSGTVAAKVYALYAQANPVLIATNASGTPRPTPPDNVRVEASSN